MACPCGARRLGPFLLLALTVLALVSLDFLYLSAGTLSTLYLDHAARSDSQEANRGILDVIRPKHWRNALPDPDLSGLPLLTFYGRFDLEYDCRDAEVETCGDVLSLPPAMVTAFPYCGVNSTKVGYKNHYMYFVIMMLLSKELQARVGVQLQATQDAYGADIVICQQKGVNTYFKEKLRRPEQSLIVIDIGDSATQFTNPPLLDKMRLNTNTTLAVLRSYAWKDRGGGCVHVARRHEVLLMQLMYAANTSHLPQRPIPASVANNLVVQAGCPEPPPEEIAKKIVLGVPFPKIVRDGGYFAQNIIQLRPISARSIDIAFMGRVTYSNPKCMAAVHRQRFLDRLAQIQEKHPEWRIFVAVGNESQKKMLTEKYREVIQDVKVFISPFGQGEWSLKDEEAVLAGAVLMKPGADILEAAVPIYTPNVTCLDVRPDWLGLEGLLKWALRDEDMLQNIQRQAYRAASGYRTYGAAVAQEDLLEKYAQVIRLGAEMHGKTPLPLP